jgi:hypothetical protein
VSSTERVRSTYHTYCMHYYYHRSRASRSSIPSVSRLLHMSEDDTWRIQ